MRQSPVQSPPAEITSGETLDISALTRQMAAGDEAAFRVFYDAYFDRLSRYLLVLTRGEEEAARDALQATLVRIVRHIKGFDQEPVFWSWLTVLARCALVDQSRKKRRYLAFLELFTEAMQVEHNVGEAETQETELLALLDQNLATLPFEDRHLLERKYFARQPVRQIAEELQTSEKAVESRLVRIRRKLKTALLRALSHE